MSLANLIPYLGGPDDKIVLAGGGRKAWLQFLQSNSMGPGDSAAMAALRAGVADPLPAVPFSRRSAGNITTPINWIAEAADDLQPRTQFVSVNFPVGSAGIELSLGRALEALEPGQWCGIQVSINGSGIEDEWDNPGYPAAPPALLDQLITEIDAQLAAMGATLELVVPMGGESDSGESPDQTNFQAHLQSILITTLRALYGPFKIVIPALSYHSNAGGSVSTVINRTHQFALANVDVAVVNTNEETFQVDNVHYSDASFLSIGDRVAAAYEDLRDGVVPANPRVVAWGVPVVGNSSSGVSPVPPTHQADDILILCHFGNGQNAYDTPAGWAHVTNSPQHDAGSGANARLTVWWLRAVDGATATPTVTDKASDGGKLAVIGVIRGCKTAGNPFVASAGSTAASGAPVAFPTVDTTGTANCLILNFLAATYNAASVAQARGAANASLANVLEEIDVFSTTSSAGGVVLSGEKAAGGAVAASTTTLSNAATQAKLTVAFAPP